MASHSRVDRLNCNRYFFRSDVTEGSDHSHVLTGMRENPEDSPAALTPATFPAVEMLGTYLINSM